MLANLGFADKDKTLPLHDLACQYLAKPENVELIFERVIKPKIGTDIPRSFGHRDLKGQEKKKVTTIDKVSDKQLISKNIFFEGAISKGTGQYRTTIGFIDVGINLVCQYIETGQTVTKMTPEIPHEVTPAEIASDNIVDHWRLRDEWQNNRRVKWEEEKSWFETEPFRQEQKDRIGIIVEVKITKINASEIIRQIKLYREYCEGISTLFFHQTYGSFSGPLLWIAATDFDLPITDVDMLKNENITHIRLGDKFHEWSISTTAPEKISHSLEV
jgi:hypothetical protein